MTPIDTAPATANPPFASPRRWPWALDGFLAWLIIYFRLPLAFTMVPPIDWPLPMLWLASLNPSLIMYPEQVSEWLVGLIAILVQLAWTLDLQRSRSGAPGPRTGRPRAFVFGTLPLVVLFLAFYSLLALAFSHSPEESSGFLGRLWLAVLLAIGSGLALGRLTKWLRTAGWGAWAQAAGGSLVAVGLPLALTLRLNPALPDGDYFFATMTALVLMAQALLAG